MPFAGGIANMGYQCGMLWGAAFSEDGIEPSTLPVSCASMLAKKMGVSEMHTIMAAGFAGGIGLSGGACGALGAAVWIIGLNQSVEIEGFSYSGTWVSETINNFLENSDYEFECSKIVGRKFEDVDDHAAFVRAGGCSPIINALAETKQSKNSKLIES